MEHKLCLGVVFTSDGRQDRTGHSNGQS